MAEYEKHDIVANMCTVTFKDKKQMFVFLDKHLEELGQVTFIFNDQHKPEISYPLAGYTEQPRYA